MNPNDNTPNPLPGLTLEHWEAALETALLNSLQPLQAEIRVNTQRVLHLEQDIQDLSEDLATLPQHLSSSLSHFLAQLQSIVTSENSSDARETLQEQLRLLIAVLSSWNNQLETELDLQQQLMDSLKRLDDKIDGSERRNSLEPHMAENLQTRRSQSGP
jgi:chromosome segregation ATPase